MTRAADAQGRALAVGVDLGASNVRAALIDEHGRLLAHAVDRTDQVGGPRHVLQQIVALVAEVTRGLDRAGLAGIGLCAPGPLDGPAGLVLDIPTLPGWVDIPIAAWLAEALAMPVSLENDGVGAAIGEWRFGAGRGLQDFVYVTVSTGIGGGVIADGRVLRGRRQLAAHVGHMTVDPMGEVCQCGNRGCWEAQASGTAFGAFARRRVASAPGSGLARHGDALDARHVIAAAREGDALSLALVEREAELLGLGIVNLLHLYSPSAVVIGGGVSAGFDLLHPGIERQVQRRAMPAFREVPVIVSALGQDSGVIGAASLMLPAFRST